MGSQIPADVHEAFRAVVLDADPKDLAAKMGVQLGTLYNKVNLSDSTHHKPTLADAVLVTVLTGDKRILHSFAKIVGEVCYSLPDFKDISTDALLVHILKIEKESGDFYQRTEGALRNDNRISAREYKVIEREAYEWISAVLESLARMREMSQ